MTGEVQTIEVSKRRAEVEMEGDGRDEQAYVVDGHRCGHVLYFRRPVRVTEARIGSLYLSLKSALSVSVPLRRVLPGPNMVIRQSFQHTFITFSDAASSGFSAILQIRLTRSENGGCTAVSCARPLPFPPDETEHRIPIRHALMPAWATCPQTKCLYQFLQSSCCFSRRPSLCILSAFTTFRRSRISRDRDVTNAETIIELITVIWSRNFRVQNKCKFMKRQNSSAKLSWPGGWLSKGHFKKLQTNPSQNKANFQSRQIKQIYAI